MSNITETTIQQALEFAYEKAIAGFPGTDSAIDLAVIYKNEIPNNKMKQANALIKKQIAMAATSGFLTGLGGLITLPLTIPVNLASVLFIQTRMIVSIAIIGGYDPNDEKVKTLVFSCLAGSKVKDILKDIGIEAGKKLVIGNLADNLSRGTIVRINRSIGYGLLAKFGGKGAANLSKMVPLVGGVIGGAMDAAWVLSVGKIAKSLFIKETDILC
jgi:uncharacterized protein (DUF697 family)